MKREGESSKGREERRNQNSCRERLHNSCRILRGQQQQNRIPFQWLQQDYILQVFYSARFLLYYQVVFFFKVLKFLFLQWLLLLTRPFWKTGCWCWSGAGSVAKGEGLAAPSLPPGWLPPEHPSGHCVKQNVGWREPLSGEWFAHWQGSYSDVPSSADPSENGAAAHGGSSRILLRFFSAMALRNRTSIDRSKQCTSMGWEHSVAEGCWCACLGSLALLALIHQPPSLFSSEFWNKQSHRILKTRRRWGPSEFLSTLLEVKGGSVICCF